MTQFQKKAPSNISRVEREGKSWIEKRFKKQDAIDFSRSEDRFLRLASHSQSIYPKLLLYETETEWFVGQEFVEIRERKYSFTRSELGKIAENIDRLHDAKLIHGDLCFSNIGFDRSDALLIFDWEINLETRIGGRLSLRTTPYCLHPTDQRIKRISRRTDQFALVALCLVSRCGHHWRSSLSRNQKVRNQTARYIDRFGKDSCANLLRGIMELADAGRVDEIFMIPSK